MGRPTRAAAKQPQQTKVIAKPDASKVTKKKEPVVQAKEVKQNLKKQLATKTPIETDSPRVGRPRKTTQEAAAKSPKPVVKEIPVIKSSSTTLRNATSPRPRGPGRPRKSTPHASPDPKPRIEVVQKKKEESDEGSVMSPRPRGRPRKSSPPPPAKKTVQKDTEVGEEKNIISPRPRGPGRPRKSSPPPQPVAESKKKMDSEIQKETPRRGRSGADKSPARNEELEKKETSKRETRKDKESAKENVEEESNGVEEEVEEGEDEKATTRGGSRRREVARSSPRAAKKAAPAPKRKTKAVEEDATVEQEEENFHTEVEKIREAEEEKEHKDVEEEEKAKDTEGEEDTVEEEQVEETERQEETEENEAEREALEEEKEEPDKENTVEELPDEDEPIVVEQIQSPVKKKKKKNHSSMQFKEISVEQAKNTFAKLKSSAQQSPQVSLDFSKATLQPSIVKTKKMAPKPKPKPSQSVKKLIDTLSLTPKQAQHLMKSLVETASKVGQEVKYMVSTDASTGQAMLLQMPQQKPQSPRKVSNDFSKAKASTQRPVSPEKPSVSLDLSQSEESTPKRRRISAASQEMESDPNLHEFLKKRKERKGGAEESADTPTSSSNIIVRCSACKKYFEPGRDFTRHKEQCLKLHARCPDCQKYYPRGDEYDEHIKYCGTGVTPTPSANYSTINASALKPVKSQTAGQFNCLICRQVFSSYKDMRHHEETCALVQPGDHGGIMCSDCRQVFVNRIFLSRHKTQYPGCPRKPINYPGSTPRRAAATAAESAQDQQLEANIIPATKPSTDGQPPINLMVSFDSGAPQLDLKTSDSTLPQEAEEDGNQVGVVKAEDDGLTEAERNMVMVQGVTMADGTPVSKCPLCDKLFKHIQYLKKHFQAFHHLDFSSYFRAKDTKRNARSETLRQNAQEKSCMCLDCGQNIPSRVELSAHKKVCTKRPVPTTVASTSFPCTLCNEINFSSRLALYEHIRQAHNEDAVLAQPIGQEVGFGYKVIEQHGQVVTGQEEMQTQMVKEEKPQLAMQEYVTQEAIEQQQAVAEETAVEQEDENVIRVQGDTNFITVKMVTDTDKEGKEMVLDLNRLRSLMKPDEKGVMTVPLSALQGAAVEAMEEAQEVVYETQEGQMELPEGHQVVTEYVPEEQMQSEVIKMESESIEEIAVQQQQVSGQEVQNQTILQQQIPDSTVVSSILQQELLPQQSLIQQQHTVLQPQQVTEQTLIEHAVLQQSQASGDQVHEGQQQYIVQTADGTVLEAVTISNGQEMVVEHGVPITTTAEMQIAHGQVMVEASAADAVHSLTQVVDAAQMEAAEPVDDQPMVETPAGDNTALPVPVEDSTALPETQTSQGNEENAQLDSEQEAAKLMEAVYE